jgi:integrase
MPNDIPPAADPFRDPNLPSLAEALAKFDSMPDETPSRKARARAAVATFGRLLHKSPAEIPAQGVYLKNRFMKLKHRPTGLTAKSLANCKTELRYLVRTVCGRGRRSDLRPLSAEWVRLRETINEKPVRWKLSRFMAFCSSIGVAPDSVDDAVVERFRIAVHDSDEVNKPENLVRIVIQAWNALVSTRADWPQITLFLSPARSSRWTIDPQMFPEAFRQDVDQWQDGLSKVDPEAEEGRIHPLRPESLRLHRHQVFKAASALVFTGRPIETVTSLACLVEFEAFKKILGHLRERQGGRPTTALLGLARTLKAIAKHQTQMGEQHVLRMARICANYAHDLEGRVSKSRVRLQIFEDERLFAALLHLPDRLLEEARHPGTSARKARLLAQVAIAIEIEWHAPLRLANLACLNLQRNIQAVTVKGQLRWIIRFDRHETKNRSLLVYELPTAAVQRIQYAFRFYEQTNGWLFPGGKGSRKLPSLLGVQVTREVERRLGKPFNIHLFRGLGATTQVKENDNGFEIARAMLGDRSDSVIRSYYTPTAERHLIAQAQETIQRVRIRTAPLVSSTSHGTATDPRAKR